MGKFLRFLFSRVVVIVLLIAVQAAVLFLTIWQLSNDYVYVYACFSLLSLLVTLGVINNTEDSPEFKLAWVVPILLFPVFGGLFYLLFRGGRMSRREKEAMEKWIAECRALLTQSESTMARLQSASPAAARQSAYLEQAANFPVYERTETTYLSPGEDFFAALKAELLKAERYIFLEYFIIDEGVMWQEILDILQAKVQMGVEVRVMYDDFGSIMLLPASYPRKLEAMGMKCVRFNTFRPWMDLRMNYRDHRKICVIDGHTAFTGGINLADEYINAKEVHGHWKDSGLLVRGEAVWNMTIMFLEMWNACRWRTPDKDFEQYRPLALPKDLQPSGFVQPFGDWPLNHEQVGESAYLQVLNYATEYVYINTPYLIIDNDLMTAMKLAAKRGVDVRIVTPGIADKWYVHLMTRSYYAPLLEAGVKIYEYSPGFIHAKSFVSDDATAIVGSINLDYRSLYHHFEDAVWLHQTASVEQIKADFVQTLAVCRPINLEDTQNVGFFTRLLRSLIRLFAPLM